MKKVTKILSIVLALILSFSSFGMVMASASSVTDASLSVNISVPSPRVGNYPSTSLYTSDSSIYITDVTWAYRAPGEGAYHIMSSGSTFQSGYSYRVYIDYEPNYNSGVPIGYNPQITINGSYASASSNSFSKVYYDFGTPSGSGSSGGSSDSGDSGFSIFDILLLPLEIIIFPFAFIAGFISGLFGF